MNYEMSTERQSASLELTSGWCDLYYLCSRTREARYKWASSTARLFRVVVGVHQGSVLSPLLFITVLEAIPKEVLEKMNTLKFRNGEGMPAN